MIANRGRRGCKEIKKLEEKSKGASRCSKSVLLPRLAVIRMARTMSDINATLLLFR